MDILVIAATDFEMGPIRSKMKKNDRINFLVTGPGSVATTYQLTNQLNYKHYDLCIQTGIAGSFVKTKALGEAVVVSSDYFGDLGVIEGQTWISLFDLKLLEPNKAPFKNEWLINKNSVLIKKTGLQPVKAVTVNEVSTRKNVITFYRRHLDAEIESMEGAAFHYVCILKKIPFVQIRAISNYVGERDKAKWKIKEAIENLHEITTNLIEKL